MRNNTKGEHKLVERKTRQNKTEHPFLGDKDGFIFFPKHVFAVY
jgi:hypothetical protein